MQDFLLYTRANIVRHLFLFLPGPHLERFYATPYSIVLQENHKKLEKVEPDRCAQACLEETAFVCRSFDYQVRYGGEGGDDKEMGGDGEKEG